MVNFLRQVCGRIDRLLSGEIASWLAVLIPYALWCLGDAADVVVAFSESEYRMGATWIGWKDAFPWAGWVVACCGLAVAVARSMWQVGTVDVARLRLGGYFVAGVVAIRVICLFDPIGRVFPWLGLLWSPSASWAMSLFVALWPHLSQSSASPKRWPAGRNALSVFAFFALIYCAYAVYFVKTTTLHGDEPQYLLITQSLLEDGDIDLANADESGKLAFHEFDFDVHRAPASPPDRLHSSHPVGLPVLMMAPYAAGDWLWGHPRLAAVLFQAVLCASACGLIVVFLFRQGYTTREATASAVLMGLSVPLFTQSNQIYPEIHAVLVTLFVLILFPTWPFGTAESRSTFHVVAVTAALVVLPFFHQRHLILAIVLALPILDTVRRAGFGSILTKFVTGVLALGVMTHLFYNLHYSGDIWGPFLPGNADTLKPDFLRSIPGQWIDRREGLLRQAPIYVVTMLGVIRFVQARDRRLMLFGALFAATAGVNTLGTDWTFGFCYPARFMVTAIPALALGFASGLSTMLSRKKPGAIWLSLFAFSLGIETLTQNAILPEVGFEGLNLVSRVSEPFYPTSIHYVDFVSGDVLSPGVCAFWAVMIFSMGVSIGFRPWARSGITVAAIAPLLLSYSLPYHTILNKTFAYQVPRFNEDSEKWFHSRLELSVPMKSLGQGTFVSGMPPLFRGIVEVTPGVSVVPDAGGVRAFHTYSNTTDGLKRAGRRYTIPLINSREQSSHRFVTSGTAVSRQHHYSLGADPGPTVWSLKASSHNESRDRVFEEDLSHFPQDRPVVMTLDGFGPGDYELVLHREGASWADWFERGQSGTVLGIFTGFQRVRTDPEGLARMGESWLEGGWRDPAKPLPDEYFPPQVEASIPYFWSLLPSMWDRSAVNFSLEREGPVHLVILQEEHVRVTGFRVDRLHFGPRAIQD